MQSMRAPKGSTRSGKEYSPWRVVKAPKDFDYAALLRQSTADAETLEALDDIDVTPSEAAAQPTDPTTDPLPRSSSSTATAGPSHVTPRNPRKKENAASSKRKKANAASSKQRPGLAPKSTMLANERRKNRRVAQKIEHGHRPSAAAFEKYVKGAPTVFVGLDSVDLPATAGGYGARNAPKSASFRDVHTKAELVEERGFTPLQWNGIDPLLVVDGGNRICAALVGRPKQEAYRAAAQSLHETLMAEGAASGLTERVTPHLRGKFPAINVGAMHGKGTINPINLGTKGNGPMVARLLKNPHVRQLAAFASYSLSLFAPKLYKHARGKLNDLYDNTPGLERLFPADVSIFPTAAFNLGPNVWTYQHRDTMNLAYAWCAIQALGDFDPEKGGHLVLWELRLVIEFPPGALVLIPSATITHSNVPVAEGDTRSSFTQYMPGGLFRWIDYGYCLVEDCKTKNPELYREQLNARPHKWQMGLDLLTTVDKLQAELDAA